MRPALRSFTHEDGDAFCKSFGRLRIETPSKFQCVTVQSFAPLPNELSELSQFAPESLVTAFFLQPRQEKIQVVLTTEQFTQNVGVMRHLLQNYSVEWLQNAQLIPDILHSLAPGVKIFRLRIVDRFVDRN